MAAIVNTISLTLDTSDSCVSILVHEVTWPDSEEGFLFRTEQDAINCAERERAPIRGTVRTRYVF